MPLTPPRGLRAAVARGLVWPCAAVLFCGSTPRVPLAPVEVAASGEDEPGAVAQNPSRFVEVIDGEDATVRVESAADLLEDAAGVRVRRYGGLGSFATVSIRGSSPSQVPVLVDGVPVSDAAAGVVNLEDLPVADLERIEVYRGFAPLGAEAGIGGAVEIVTRAAPSGGPVELTSGLSVGSFGTRRAFATAASTLGACGPVAGVRSVEGAPALPPCPGLRLTFGHLRTAGDFEFRSDGGTPLDPSDDLTLERIDNDFAQTYAAARLAVPFSAWDLDASASFSAADRGLPGLDYDQARRARLAGTASRLRLEARVPSLATGAVDLRAGVFGSARTDRFEDPEGELGVGSQIEDDVSASAGAWASASIALGGGTHVLDVRIEGRGEYFLPGHELPEPRDGPTQSRWLAAAGAEWEASFLDDALVTLLAARLEIPTDVFSGDPYFTWMPEAPDPGARTDVLFSPSAGVRWAATGWLDVKANAGWFHRVPAFPELFGDRGSVVGNPSLGPESALNLDAGVAAAPLGDREGFRLRLDAAFFASFADDLILFVPQSQSVFRAENVGAARTLGVEATLRAAWSDRVSVVAAYTWEDARDAGDTPYWTGNRLPGRPEHDVSVRVEGSFGPFEAWYELAADSGNFLDRANLRSAPSRLLHGAGLTTRFDWPGHEIRATIEGVNLGDAYVYDAFRYPLPGRAFFATLRVGL